MPAEASGWPNAAMHGRFPLDPACYVPRVSHCTQLILPFYSVVPVSCVGSCVFVQRPALVFSLLFTSSLCLAALKRRNAPPTGRPGQMSAETTQTGPDGIPCPEPHVLDTGLINVFDITSYILDRQEQKSRRSSRSRDHADRENPNDFPEVAARHEHPDMSGQRFRGRIVMPEVKKARAVGFNHVALEVGDIEEALAFYGRLFEFKLRGKSADMAIIDLGDQFLALQKGRRQAPDDGRHFGLVVDDKEAVRRAAKEAGLK